MPFWTVTRRGNLQKPRQTTAQASTDAQAALEGWRGSCQVPDPTFCQLLNASSSLTAFRDRPPGGAFNVWAGLPLIPDDVVS
jgi:hypothetical protein